MTQAHVIVTHPGDNVATALRDLDAGQSVEVPGSERVTTLQVRQAVQRGHKVALAALSVGEPVVKYGEAIGVATAVIEAGEHVHVHNLGSTRAGGADRGEAS